MEGRPSSRRASIAAALAASTLAAAVIVGACRGVVVGDESKYISVVEHFCECSDTYPELFQDHDDCIQLLSSRLGASEGEVLKTWLAKYESECSKSCSAVRACYYTLPVCSFHTCRTNEECCSYDGGTDTCDAGTCAE